MSPEPNAMRRAGDASTAGQGAFVLVVGPSGAGKDTLIAGARSALAGDESYIFARRAITRPSDRWEDHESLSEAEFDEAKQSGQFAFAWSAHGLRYGVPKATFDQVRQGHVVVCNGSRSSISSALSLFVRTKIVLITAPREVRLSRLKARGRETDVMERLDRLPEHSVENIADLLIDNTGASAAGIEMLTAFLRSLASPA